MRCPIENKLCDSKEFDKRKKKWELPNNKKFHVRPVN